MNTTREPLTEYRITIEGRLDDHWSSWFDDLTITSLAGPGGAVSTQLCGPLPDQAALLGVLRKLHALGLRLVTVERIAPRHEGDAHEA